MTVIAFTRPERRLPESISLAEAAGFTVLAAPSLEIVPCSTGEMEGLLLSIKPGDVVVFTSATAAEECGGSPLFVGAMKNARVISIGKRTADALRRFGVSADEIPAEYSSKGLVEYMQDIAKGKRVILIRAEQSSRVLDRGLREIGADVIDFVAYSLKPADPMLLNDILDAGSSGRIDVFAFMSPLSAESFVVAARNKGINAQEMLRRARVAAIGRPTADMLASLGIKVDIMPENAIFEDLLSEIKKSTEK